MTLTGVTEIVDGQFTGAISDATAINLNVTDDEVALKFYSAYLLASSLDWKVISRSGETSFQKQNPETYKNLFDLRITALADQESDSPIAGMVINSDPKYNE